MFERQVALEKAQGVRGLATRLAGPMDSPTVADQVRREMCVGLVTIGALQVLLGARYGWPQAILGLCLAIPAASLFFLRSRVLAVATIFWYLFLFAGVLLGAKPGLLGAVLWVAVFMFWVRASRAIYVYQRLTRSPSSALGDNTAASQASIPKTVPPGIDV